MRSIRRSSVTALTAAMALAAVALPAAYVASVTSPTSAAVTPAGIGDTTDAYLAIEKGSQDRIALYPPGDATTAPTPLATQKISATASGCALVTIPGDETTDAIMRFNGRFGGNQQAESWAPGSIGVAEKKSGTSCYQVSAPGETLDVAVGAAAKPSGSATARYLARAANLDVELKQDARIFATAKLAGATVGYFELQSGSSINKPKITTGVNPSLPYAVFKCNNPSDSGPDSGVNDNCRWPMNGVLFDTLSIQSLVGSYSLEYGRDGTVTQGSVPTAPQYLARGGASFFELTTVDGLIGCTAGTNGNNTTVTVTATTGKPGVQVARLPNASDPSGGDCVPVPYTLKSLDSSARFLKPMDQQNTAQFVMTMEWTTDNTSATSPESLPPTYANYETGGKDVQLGWCPDPIYDSSGNLAGIASPLTSQEVPDQDLLGSATYQRKDALNPGTPLSGKQFSCIGIRTAQVVDKDPLTGSTVEPDKIVVREQIYVLGDILMRK
jgi:hypothetical protein